MISTPCQLSHSCQRCMSHPLDIHITSTSQPIHMRFTSTSHAHPVQNLTMQSSRALHTRVTQSSHSRCMHCTCSSHVHPTPLTCILAAQHACRITTWIVLPGCPARAFLPTGQLEPSCRPASSSASDTSTSVLQYLLLWLDCRRLF